MSLLAAQYSIVIDRQIDAPGHGKDVVDGLNAQDKVYLRKFMITARNPCTTGSDDTGKLKMEAAVVDGQNKAISFAKQCIKICSQDTRNRGVITQRISKKREQNNKMKKRFYHFQEFDKVEFQNTKFGKKCFEEGDCNGIMGHYNFRFDADLDLGYCAARRIPCACRSCIDQLKLPWDNAKDKKDQPRYLQNQNCIMWKMFEGLNDWRIVEISPISNNERDSKKVKSTIYFT